MPELRQLRAFVAVAEELNFTRAAERLFLGQQAVSKSIQQLERELGVVLLERTSHAVRLTPAGEALLRDGRDVVARFDALFERTREIGRGRAGTIHVGVSPAVGQTERDALVRALRQDADDVSVALREVWPDQVAPLLRSRDLELVLTRTTLPGDDVEHVTLAPTPARLYVPTGHRLAERAGPVPLHELDGERLLTWNEPGTPLTDLLLARLAAAGATVRPTRARVSGMAASPLADLPELGAVALGPPQWPDDERLVELELAEVVALPLLLLWPTGAPTAAVRRARTSLSP